MSVYPIRVLGFKQEFRPDGRVVDWVHFTSGDAMNDTGAPTHSTWIQVSRIRPPEVIENDDGGLRMAALRSQWAQIERHYEAWREGNELPEEGTPLGAWAGVSPEQAEALKRAGLRTVESIANASEDRLMKPPVPHMRELQRQARQWLEGRSKAELEAKLRQLEEQNAAMLEMLADQDGESKKRGPGRPRKAETEAA